MSAPFADRATAGRLLGLRLRSLDLKPPLVVLALPRGAVPVATAAAQILHAPLDLLLVRKIGAPWQPELALAAVVEGSPAEIVVDDALQREVDRHSAYIKVLARVQLREIARQRQVYLRGRPAIPVEGRTVIVVGDGIATAELLAPRCVPH